MKHLALIALALCLTACGQKTILIQAEGMAEAAPDIVRIGVTNTTHADTPAAATQKSNERVSQVLRGLEAVGVKSKQVLTSFSMSQACDYDRNNGRQVCSGFNAKAYIRINLENLEKTGSVLSTLAALNVDEIDAPSFELRDASPLETEARVNAISNATKSASEYAAKSGWQLGRMVNVESTEALGSEYSRLSYGREARRYALLADSAPPQRDVPVTPLNVTATDSIFVQFELVGAWNLFGDKALF